MIISFFRSIKPLSTMGRKISEKETTYSRMTSMAGMMILVIKKLFMG